MMKQGESGDLHVDVSGSAKVLWNCKGEIVWQVRGDAVKVSISEVRVTGTVVLSG